MMQEEVSPKLPPVYLIPRRRLLGATVTESAGGSEEVTLSPLLVWEIMDVEGKQRLAGDEFIASFQRQFNS